MLAQSDATSEEVALVAELLSIPINQSERIQLMTPQLRREKTLAALLAMSTGLAVRKPVLIVYEDIHWIDPSSRELLDRLIQQLERLPVLLLATFRAEFQPPWIGQANVTSIALTRLDPRETAAMIAGIAGENGLSTGLTQEIAERTDGVPLFVEELTKAVLESGVQSTQALSTTLDNAFSVPATLYTSLLPRLDRLGRTAKLVVQRAAAVGRDVSYELLASIADLSQPELRETLSLLTSSGLLLARGIPPHTTYTFQHVLVQDAAYGTLLRRPRQQLHAQIASVLVAKFPDFVETQPELVAHHFSRAGETSRAVEFWLKAGQHAMRRSAMVEAEALFRKGLHSVAALPDGTQRQEYELDLQMALGRALVAIRGHGTPVVSEIYARARQLCYQLHRPEKLTAALWGQWTNLLIRDLEEASQLAAELRALAEARDDAVARVTAYRASGLTSILLGDFLQARISLERALSLYDSALEPRYSEVPPDDGLVMTLGYLSIALAFCGYLDHSRSNLNAALARARQLHHGFTLVSALSLGWKIRRLLGSSPTELLQHADEVLAITASEGLNSTRRAAASCHRGWCLAITGHAGEGIPMLKRGVAELRKVGPSLALPIHLTKLADAYRIIGNPEIALKHLAEAEQLAETHNKFMLVGALRLQGELLLKTDDKVGAHASFRKAIQIARRQGAKLFELRASTSLARLWRDQGRIADAHDLLAPIYNWFTEGFDAPDLIEAKALLDELEAARGRSPTAAMAGTTRI